MKWEVTDILKSIAGGGMFAALTTVLASAMGWVRFGKKDNAEVGKVRSETALDIATIREKKISDEIKISEAALQWTINISARLEKEQQENDRLHSIIDNMKRDFEKQVQKLTNDFNQRIKDLENEFEKSKRNFIKEREENIAEITRLKKQVNGNG